jgi:hypothetical protein
MTKPSAGDRVILNAGTYSCTEMTWNFMNSGSDFGAGAIVIKPAPGAVVTLTGIVGDHVINLKKGQHYLIFQDLILDGLHAAINGVKITGDGTSVAMDAHHIRLLGLEIKNTQNSGILTAPRFANGCQHNEIQYCNVHDLGTRDLDHGMYVESGFNIIEHNHVHDIQLGYGIQLDNGTDAEGNVVRFNRIHDVPRKAGIIITTGSTSLVYGNVVYDCVWGINADVPAEIDSNTVWNAVYPLYFYPPDGSVIVAKNNIAITNATISIHIESGSGAHVIQNNFMQRTDGSSSIILNNGFGSRSGITGNITGGVIAFVDAANYDFHLQSNSAARDAGLDLSLLFTTDFDGIARPQGLAYDVGAYEFR